MSDKLLPSQIAQALREGTNDPDLHLSLAQVIESFEEDEQVFLAFYSAGYTPHEAARQAGATNKQPMRWFRTLILKLTEEINK